MHPGITFVYMQSRTAHTEGPITKVTRDSAASHVLIGWTSRTEASPESHVEHATQHVVKCWPRIHSAPLLWSPFSISRLLLRVVQQCINESAYAAMFCDIRSSCEYSKGHTRLCCLRHLQWRESRTTCASSDQHTRWSLRSYAHKSALWDHITMRLSCHANTRSTNNVRFKLHVLLLYAP